MKCCICSHNNGKTQIKIHSSCFDKPIIINIDSEDTNFEIIENLLMLLQNKKEKENINIVEV